MKTFAASEAKNEFGRLLDTAQREPVTIEKKGRPVAVVLSLEEYERLEALDDAWWAARADEAAEEGFIGPEESEKLMRELL
ncbi:MAG: type II toxin-antitoxin system Phd/YefM family antitoxin, partial [Alphaproteobacteria bacterium]